MKDIKGLGDLVGDLTESNQPKTSVGRSILIKGEISGDEFLSVEGRIEGKINLNNGIHIKKNGLIKADMHATSIAVSGKVVGNIHATEKIELMEDSKVIGDLNAPRIVINEGARLSGQIKMEFQIEELAEPISPIAEIVTMVETFPTEKAIAETVIPITTRFEFPFTQSVQDFSIGTEPELSHISTALIEPAIHPAPFSAIEPVSSQPAPPIPDGQPDAAPPHHSVVFDYKPNFAPNLESDDHSKHRSSFIVQNKPENTIDPMSNKSTGKSGFKN